MLAFKHKTCYNTAKPDGGSLAEFISSDQDMLQLFIALGV